MAVLVISGLLLPLLHILLVAAGLCGASEGVESPLLISRIAFGSCSNQSAPQPIWNAIIDFDPQLFIWLGDNIYGDNKRPFRVLGKERTIGPWKNVPRFYPATEQELRARYELAKSNPGYSKLRQRVKDVEVFTSSWIEMNNMPPLTILVALVIGTWDDHDYGLNDAGKEFIGKNTSQRLLLDFLDEPEDSPRRKQAGVYASYLFGPRGKQIKVILLDTRFHRDPLFSDGSILGDSQWKWLERELNGPESEITIIASSIQVISSLSAYTGPFFYMESWGLFPKERERLFKLIDNSKRTGIFFISGDVHFGEITRYDCGSRYSLYDITSSGLTQAVENNLPRPLRFLVRILAWLTPTITRIYTPNCRYRSCTYGQPNFGAVEIDWNAKPQRISIELRDVNGHLVNGVNLSLLDLQPRKMPMTHRKGEGYHHHCSLEVDLPWILRYRLVFLFSGAIAVMFVVTVLLTNVILTTSKNFLQKSKKVD